MNLEQAYNMLSSDKTPWTSVEHATATDRRRTFVCQSDLALRIEESTEGEEFYAGNRASMDDREDWLKAVSPPYYSLRETEYIAFYGASPFFQCRLVRVDGGRAIMPWPNIDPKTDKPAGFDLVELGVAGAVCGWKALRSYAEKAKIPLK